MCQAAEPRRPKLPDQVREAIRARLYSRRTEDAYVDWIKRLIVFHGIRHPAEMGAQELTAFLSSFAVELPWLDEVVRVKKPARLPVVLRALRCASGRIPW